MFRNSILMNVISVSHKFLAIALAVLFLFLPFHQRVQADAGDLDSEFGDGGRVITDFGSTSDRANAVAVQFDGKIVVVGDTTVGIGSFDFAMARYNSNGDLDESFGNGGKVTTDFFGSIDEATDVVIQPDGKIIVAGGASNNSTGVDFGLARYNSDGSLDLSFGNGGKVVADFFGRFDEALAMALQEDGKIIIAGFTVNNNQNEIFALARYNENGTLDNRFGDGGKVTTTFELNSRINDVVIQRDGKIVAAGHIANALGQGVFTIARYRSNGKLDSGFGTGGSLTTPFGPSDTANSLAIQPDGKIIAAGSVSTSVVDFGLARYNINGSPDNSFGNGGKVTTDFFGSTERIKEIIIQPDNKIIAFGDVFLPDTLSLEFGVARYNSDGSLDFGFGVEGKRNTSFGGAFDLAQGAALQPDGKIVVVGFTRTNRGDDDVAIARYESGIPIPNIATASTQGKKLFVEGENFDAGAKILINGQEQKTKSDATDPTKLVAKKGGKNIKSGDKLRVRNSNGILSPEFIFP